MYSSVKEHQQCVNRVSSVCHMDTSPVTWIAVLPCRDYTSQIRGWGTVSVVHWGFLKRKKKVNQNTRAKKKKFVIWTFSRNPQEWQLGMCCVTTWPMIYQRWVWVGRFRACAECVTPLPHLISIPLFHILFWLTDSSDGLTQSLSLCLCLVCKNGVASAAAALLLLLLFPDSLFISLNYRAFVWSLVDAVAVCSSRDVTQSCQWCFLEIPQ